MPEPRPECKVRWLLSAGALGHLIATAAVYAVGRSAVLPHLIAPDGVIRGDGTAYLERVTLLGQRISGLASSNEQIHVRLYAVSTAVLNPIIGKNIFSIELISLPLYLLALFLVYELGKICFEPRVGLAAAVIVGLFPSLLLHETQPLRDPLFIVLFLAFMGLMLRLLTKSIRAILAVAYAAIGFVVLLLAWLVRDAFWMVYVGIVALALMAVIARALKERRACLANFVCLIFFLAASLFIPKGFSNWLPQKEPTTMEQKQLLDEFKAQQIHRGQAGVFLRISVMRQKFLIMYQDAGSNIDVDRAFPTAGSVIAYLPRAVLIGLFAPFPKSWFEEGKMYGLAGRLLAGLEVCFIYFLTPFAVAGVWRYHHRIQTWFLLAVTLLGAAALGLVVANVGALYRMRYGFWIVLIVLAASSLPRSLSLRPRVPLISSSNKQSA